MKNLLLILSFLFLISCSKDDNENDTSQNTFDGKLIFAKTFGGSDEEYVRGVTATKDGGFVVVGYTKSNDGSITNKVGLVEDIWLTKYDEKGSPLWSKTYGGSLDDFGYSVTENNDGSLVIAGYSKSSDGDVPSNLGMHDFFIFKTDASGNMIWKKNYGFTSHDHAHKIIATKDGGYFIVGYVDYSGFNRSAFSVLHGVGEYYGIKLNASGEKQWDCYFGGTQNDRVFDVVESNNGGFVMVGYSESNDFDITDNHGSYDYWVVKIDALGNSLWKKSYGGSELDQAYGIAKSINNTYLIVGTSDSSNGDVSLNKGENDVWIISIDDNGTKLWDKSYGGSSSETANSIKVMSNGNFVVSGHTRSTNIENTTDGHHKVKNLTNRIENLTNRGENDFWVFTISPSGNMLWQNTYGGSNFDFAYDATEILDKGIIIVGETQSNDFDIQNNRGIKDLLIVKVH